MKKFFFLIGLSASFFSCRHGRNVPDVSNVQVDLKIERFDQAFFALDSNNLSAGLSALNQQFPYFTNDFLVNILGIAPSPDSLFAVRRFLSSYYPVKDSLSMSFRDVKPLEKQLKEAFQFVKYYFPDYKLPPKTVAYIGPFDAPGVALTRYTMAIGLQLYAGRNFSFYNSMQGQELYPLYISRRFEPNYIPENCMKAIAEDLYPDNSGNRPLIEQMIEKGKYWWLTQQFLPESADSLKTGYTQKQLDWCRSNEGLIWNYVLQNTDLFSLDPDLIKNYIGEAPSTNGMPDGAPGNIGQWLGWQIVKKYAAEHPSLIPAELMKIPARKLFDEARYKPK